MAKKAIDYKPRKVNMEDELYAQVCALAHTSAAAKFGPFMRHLAAQAIKEHNQSKDGI